MNTADVDRVLALVRAYGIAARETEKLARSGHRIEAALRANKRTELYKDIGMELYRLARPPLRVVGVVGTCGDCGHNADAHDTEDGHCLVGLVGARRCDCVGFEAIS